MQKDLEKWACGIIEKAVVYGAGQEQTVKVLLRLAKAIEKNNELLEYKITEQLGYKADG